MKGIHANPAFGAGTWVYSVDAQSTANHSAHCPGTDGCISDRLHSDDRDLHDLPETVYRRYCYQRWKTVIRNIT